MNSRNSKTESVRGKESASSMVEKEEVRVITARLVEAADLAISEVDDKGSDPYNSTGQHVIIAPKIDLQD
jgi:hypothetical protein